MEYENKMKQINLKFQQRCKKLIANNLEECDAANAKDPQYVVEFTRYIMHHYLRVEINNQPNTNYMVN